MAVGVALSQGAVDVQHVVDQRDDAVGTPPPDGGQVDERELATAGVVGQVRCDQAVARVRRLDLLRDGLAGPLPRGQLVRGSKGGQHAGQLVALGGQGVLDAGEEALSRIGIRGGVGAGRRGDLAVGAKAGQQVGDDDVLVDAGDAGQQRSHAITMPGHPRDVNPASRAGLAGANNHSPLRGDGTSIATRQSSWSSSHHYRDAPRGSTDPP